jgi:hypothetical protein
MRTVRSRIESKRRGRSDKPAKSIGFPDDLATECALLSREQDSRGKLVLLDFWAGWQNDMTVLKGVQEKFGSDPRFVVISL